MFGENVAISDKWLAVLEQYYTGDWQKAQIPIDTYIFTKK